MNRVGCTSRWVLLALSAAVAATGCKRGDSETGAARAPAAGEARAPAEVGATPSAREALFTDSDVTAAVVAQLVEDQLAEPDAIVVTTTEGIVQLTGTVDNLLARDRAERIAEAVRGVRGVSNRILVVPKEKSDEAITQDVEHALLYNRAADAREVDAKARAGVVTLTGTVGSWHERQLAERLAKGVSSVRHVKNELVIDYERNRTDGEVQADVESRLRWDVMVGEGLIDVNVRDGAVRLTGFVGSAAEKSRAFSDAWVAGVQAVDISGLEVDPLVRDEDVRKFQRVSQPDAQIAQAIRDAALYDPRVNSFELKVDVAHAVANLRGTVDTARARLAAEALARSTVGVRGVNNLITVAPAKPVTDDVLKRRIVAALATNPITDSYSITVEVDDGQARLSGKVETQYERAEAMDIASRVVGVTALDNDLVVTQPMTAFVYSSYLDPYEPLIDTWYYVPTAVKSDAEIRKLVRSELRWSPFVDAEEVKVSVEAGKVTLQGTVDSWYERNVATEQAFEGGAVSVFNDLRVEGS